MSGESIQRRAFLGRVARRAAYVAPAAMALTAVRRAQGGSLACFIQGSNCLTDENNCCAGLTCQRSNGSPCTDMGMQAMTCTCEP